MSEYPFLPLSIDAYFRDTRHLSAMQHGAYLLLLMEAWQRPNSALPDDEKILARLACLSASEWDENKEVILAFWKHDARSKTYTQKRLLETKEHVKKTSRKQQSNAKSRWEKEKDTSHGNAKPPAKPMPKTSQKDASQSQSQSQSPLASPTPPTPAPARAADDAFEEVSRRLRSLPGVDKHPVYASPSINPLWGMIHAGWNLETEIIPVVTALAQRSKPGTIRSWSYFVDEIQAQRNIPAAPPPPEANYEPRPGEASWDERISFGRRNRAWPAKWGPMPNTPGCVVPAHLLLPSDGQGWKEWKPGENAA